MKTVSRTLFLSTWFLLVMTVSALGQRFVLDSEGLLTATEQQRIDSMLMAYNKPPGKVLLMGSDTLDPRSPQYVNTLFKQYFSDSTSRDYVLMLVLSRKNQAATMVASKSLVQRVRPEQLIDMIQAGAPELRAQKREAGVTLMLQKAMEYLDKLPGQ